MRRGWVGAGAGVLLALLAAVPAGAGAAPTPTQSFFTSRLLADNLRARDDFPASVGDALSSIAARDPRGYVGAIEAALESFETREDYLEDLPVADTVIVLQALAARSNVAAELSSPLLP